MEDALHYFVISTTSGFYAQHGFSEIAEDAYAFTSEEEATIQASKMAGTVISQTVQYEELEQSFDQFSSQFASLYTTEEQQQIRLVCDELSALV